MGEGEGPAGRPGPGQGVDHGAAADRSGAAAAWQAARGGRAVSKVAETDGEQVALCVFFRAAGSLRAACRGRGSCTRAAAWPIRSQRTTPAFTRPRPQASGGQGAPGGVGTHAAHAAPAPGAIDDGRHDTRPSTRCRLGSAVRRCARSHIHELAPLTPPWEAAGDSAGPTHPAHWSHPTLEKQAREWQQLRPLLRARAAAPQQQQQQQQQQAPGERRTRSRWRCAPTCCSCRQRGWSESSGARQRPSRCEPPSPAPS